MAGQKTLKKLLGDLGLPVSSKNALVDEINAVRSGPKWLDSQEGGVKEAIVEALGGKRATKDNIVKAVFPEKAASEPASGIRGKSNEAGATESRVTDNEADADLADPPKRKMLDPIKKKGAGGKKATPKKAAAKETGKPAAKKGYDVTKEATPVPQDVLAAQAAAKKGSRAIPSHRLAGPPGRRRMPAAAPPAESTPVAAAGLTPAQQKGLSQLAPADQDEISLQLKADEPGLMGESIAVTQTPDPGMSSGPQAPQVDPVAAGMSQGSVPQMARPQAPSPEDELMAAMAADGYLAPPEPAARVTDGLMTDEIIPDVPDTPQPTPVNPFNNDIGMLETPGGITAADSSSGVPRLEDLGMMGQGTIDPNAQVMGGGTSTTNAPTSSGTAAATQDPARMSRLMKAILYGGGIGAGTLAGLAGRKAYLDSVDAAAKEDEMQAGRIVIPDMPEDAKTSGGFVSPENAMQGYIQRRLGNR